MKGGVLSTLESSGGWLKTRDTFGDFELRLQFRLAAKANSGVFLRADGSTPHVEGLEIQLLDDAAFPGTAPERRCGALMLESAPRKEAALAAGRWQSLSWNDFYTGARRVAGGLVRLGLERGERVAILGPTHSPWGRYDMGAQLAGMVSLGIYPKQAPDQIRYILEHSESRVIVVDEESELDAVFQAAAGLDKLIATRVTELSRARIQAIIRAGHVGGHGGATIRDGAHRVKPGEVFTVEMPPPEPAAPSGEAIPLGVVFEDRHLIVIDKPAHVVVHPAAGARAPPGRGRAQVSRIGRLPRLRLGGAAARPVTPARPS